ncbi:MAG: hypothetical protein MJA28_15265 [Gammaproteobacteria bacterium]|nr:hypothetical protein [Gammaproteobacteria bacterium]
MLVFSKSPGIRERHLIRKQDNPLLVSDKPLSQQDIREARTADQKEVNEFLVDLYKLIAKAPKLDLEENFDEALDYMQQLGAKECLSVTLGGALAPVKPRLARMIDNVTRALWRSAAHHTHVMAQLEAFEGEREAHQELLQHQFIADLMHADNIISAHDFVQVLLYEDEDVIKTMMAVLGQDQRDFVQKKARAFARKFESLDEISEDFQPIQAALEVISSFDSRSAA